MTYQKTIFFVIALLTFTFSCGRKEIPKKTLPLTPKSLVVNIQSEIEGPLSQYLYADNEKIEVKIIRDTNGVLEPEIKFEFDVKLIFYRSGNVISGNGYNHFGPNLEAEFLDEKGKVIDLQTRITPKNNIMVGLSDDISSGNDKEEWYTFDGSINNFGITQEEFTANALNTIEQLSKVKTIRIKSSITEEKFEAKKESIKSDIPTSNINNSLSSECLEFIEGYRKFYKSYSKILKKQMSNPDDMSILLEVTELSKGLEEWGNIPSECEENLEFIKEISKIKNLY